MRYHAAGRRGLKYVQYIAGINPREGKHGTGQFTYMYTSWQCPWNSILPRGLLCTFTGLHTPNHFFFPHKDLLLHKVEKDGGKKTSSAPTIVSRIPLFEHLCPPAASSSRTPEHPGPVSGAASAAASRPRLRTGCLSPSFLGPAHPIRFC